MFWDKFITLCNSINKKPNNVASEIGISSGSITSWKKGVVPSDTNLKKIADYFGVPLSYLKDDACDYNPEDPNLLLTPEEIEQLNETIRTQKAEIDRLKRLLDLSLTTQDNLQEQIKYLKKSET